MQTKIIRTQKTDPRRNLALEEYLIESCQSGQVLLYLWQNKNTVVIGRNQNPWRECRTSLMEEEGVTLVRRSSGGGAVYHDMGNINFTFIADRELYDLHRQLGVILDALEELGIHAAFSGRNDILCDGRKFSGNAFSHKRHVSMQHGTLLVHADMEKMARYLSVSTAKMQSKGVSSVRSRVCNLEEFHPGLTIDMVAQAVIDAFIKDYAPPAQIWDDGQIDDTLLAEKTAKYASWEWTYGECPAFDVMHEERLSFGEVQLHLSAKEGLITAAKLYSDAMDADFIQRLSAVLTGCTYDAASMAAAVAPLPVRAETAPALEELCQWIRNLPL